MVVTVHDSSDKSKVVFHWRSHSTHSRQRLSSCRQTAQWQKISYVWEKDTWREHTQVQNWNRPGLSEIEITFGLLIDSRYVSSLTTLYDFMSLSLCLSVLLSFSSTSKRPSAVEAQPTNHVIPSSLRTYCSPETRQTLPTVSSILLFDLFHHRKKPRWQWRVFFVCAATKLWKWNYVKFNQPIIKIIKVKTVIKSGEIYYHVA